MQARGAVRPLGRPSHAPAAASPLAGAGEREAGVSMLTDDA